MHHVQLYLKYIFLSIAEENEPFAPGHALELHCSWFFCFHLAVRGWLSKRNSCICLITEQELWMDIIPLARCYLQRVIWEAKKSYFRGRQIKLAMFLAITINSLTRFNHTHTHECKPKKKKINALTNTCEICTYINSI